LHGGIKKIYNVKCEHCGNFMTAVVERRRKRLGKPKKTMGAPRLQMHTKLWNSGTEGKLMRPESTLRRGGENVMRTSGKEPADRKSKHQKKKG